MILIDSTAMIVRLSQKLAKKLKTSAADILYLSMTTDEYRKFLLDRIAEQEEHAQHPEVDDWFATYGGLIVREAGKHAASFGLVEAHDSRGAR